jgi:hypothetical protein
LTKDSNYANILFIMSWLSLENITPGPDPEILAVQEAMGFDTYNEAEQWIDEQIRLGSDDYYMNKLMEWGGFKTAEDVQEWLDEQMLTDGHDEMGYPLRNE